MATPLANSHYERLDLEICRRLPFTKYLKYSLLGILVLRRRTLRAFEPADHVLHRHVTPFSTCFILSPFFVCLISLSSLPLAATSGFRISALKNKINVEET